MPMTHIAGMQVRVGCRVRQRCAWCGTVLCDYDLHDIGVPEGQDPQPPLWLPGAVIRVNGNTSQVVSHEDGAELPEDACAQLDHEVTV